MTHVKCIQPLPGLLTKDLIYAAICTQKNFVTLIDDRGQQCVYSLSRFEPCLAPQAAPTFSQMQDIAANVKITQPPEDFELILGYQHLGTSKGRLLFAGRDFGPNEIKGWSTKDAQNHFNVSFSELYEATYYELQKTRLQLQEVLDAVQKHAEGGNIENYRHLDEKIEEIIKKLD